LAKARSILSPEVPPSRDQQHVMMARCLKRNIARLGTVKSPQDLADALEDMRSVLAKTWKTTEQIEAGEVEGDAA
jgi:hypothetical protein